MGGKKKNEKKITEANNVCEVRCGSGQAWQCLEMCAGVSVSICVFMCLYVCAHHGVSKCVRERESERERECK